MISFLSQYLKCPFFSCVNLFLQLLPFHICYIWGFIFYLLYRGCVCPFKFSVGHQESCHCSLSYCSGTGCPTKPEACYFSESRSLFCPQMLELMEKTVMTGFGCGCWVMKLVHALTHWTPSLQISLDVLMDPSLSHSILN